MVFSGWEFVRERWSNRAGLLGTASVHVRTYSVDFPSNSCLACTQYEKAMLIPDRQIFFPPEGVNVPGTQQCFAYV